MEKQEIIKNIIERSGGDIYLGVVGAVRTGKSTFIKKVAENLIIPNMNDEYEKKRLLDELPQSAKGKMIMTTEPKFVPSKAANIKIDNFNCKVKLIDCVGFAINGADGLTVDGAPRMVKTPWYDEEVPFVEAAEIGTEKVIKEHSTIGIVLTTDGSIGEFTRGDYLEAEEKVITELKEINKPFIVVLNTTHKESKETEKIRKSIEEKYNATTLAINIETMNKEDMYTILKAALYEYPVTEIKVSMPDWIGILDSHHEIKKKYMDEIRKSVINVDKLKDVEKINSNFEKCPEIEKAFVKEIDPKTGTVTIELHAPNNLFDKTLKEIMNIDVKTKADLLKVFQEFNIAKSEYDNIKYALKMVKETGYGVAIPKINDMKIIKPEVVKEGARYGVRIKSVAPTIHLIKVNVESTFEPIIGSEKESKELADNLLKNYKDNKENLWNSEIFGRTINNIVEEGVKAKINMMPDNIRYKLGKTITKVVNKGSNNLITIVI